MSAASSLSAARLLTAKLPRMKGDILPGVMLLWPLGMWNTAVATSHNFSSNSPWIALEPGTVQQHAAYGFYIVSLHSILLQGRD